MSEVLVIGPGAHQFRWAGEAICGGSQGLPSLRNGGEVAPLVHSAASPYLGGPNHQSHRVRHAYLTQAGRRLAFRDGRNP